jgi:hypothetical protein
MSSPGSGSGSPELAREAVLAFLAEAYGANRGFRGQYFNSAANSLRPFCAYTPVRDGRMAGNLPLDRVFPSFWHACSAVLLEWVESRVPHLPSKNRPAVYRGQTSPWPLRPSLWRASEPLAQNGAAALDAFASFLSRTFAGEPEPSYDYFHAVRTPSGAEVLAQHHEFPTNLVDFTFDPLVALYFASGNAPAAEVPGCPAGHGVIYGCLLGNLRTAAERNLFSARYDLLPPVHVGRIYQQRGVLIDCGQRPSGTASHSRAADLESACVRLFFPRDYPTMPGVEEVFSGASMAHWMADEASYWHTPQTKAIQQEWYIAYDWYLKPLSALSDYCAQFDEKFDPVDAVRQMADSIADDPAPWSNYEPAFESPPSRTGRLAEYFGTAAKLVLDACRLYTKGGWRLDPITLQCFVNANPTFFAAMSEFVKRVDLLDVVRLKTLIVDSILDPSPLSQALTEQQLGRLRALPRVVEERQVRYFIHGE